MVKRFAAILALAGMAAGCRESLERGLIYFPQRGLRADPSSVALPFREVRFEASDGVRLHGWLVHGRAGTTLLYSHGNAGNIGDRLPIVKLLVEALGVSVFIYDYRGYGRSDGVPSEAGLVRDAVAARAALVREGAATDRIAYYGRSLGAAVTLDLALVHAPAAIVLESPFLSVRAMANRVVPGGGSLLRTRWDSLEKIGRVHVPLLILHGDADEVIPYAHGRTLFEAASPPKRFFTVRGGRHYDMQRHWTDYWDAWRRFLDSAGLPTA